MFGVFHGSRESMERMLGLSWLIRLRDYAIIGQLLICLVCSLWLGIRLPVGILASCLGTAAAANIALRSLQRWNPMGADRIIAPVLFADAILLTIMLYFTGGAHNPFTMFYLLHVTMAVILLPAWGAWAMVALCTAGFWSLFHSDYSLEGNGETCCTDMDAHLKGMVAGLLLTGCGISYFVSRLAAGLRESRKALETARAEGERARRRMEVATLAASIAHELATPLGTIAILSKDLETSAGKETAHDATVIRKEVDRCRNIIEKLGGKHSAPKEETQPFHAANLGKQLSGYLSETMEKQLEIHIRNNGGNLRFPMDRLLQCLAILVKNAVEASPAGAPVILETRKRNGVQEFSVRDAGKGFPPGLVEKIGEPLVTTKTDNGGLGLGLFLVKSFATDMGGSLQIETEEGSGSTVSLLLPVQGNQQ